MRKVEILPTQNCEAGYIPLFSFEVSLTISQVVELVVQCAVRYFKY